MKAADYGLEANSASAFVSTNSLCQGEHVPNLWPTLLAEGQEISFAYTSLKWSNLASHKAGVTVVIVGLSNHSGNFRRLFTLNEKGIQTEKQVPSINAYLIPGAELIVQPASNL